MLVLEHDAHCLSHREWYCGADMMRQLADVKNTADDLLFARKIVRIDCGNCMESNPEVHFRNNISEFRGPPPGHRHPIRYDKVSGCALCGLVQVYRDIFGALGKMEHLKSIQ